MLNACEKFESCVGVSLSSSCSAEQQPMLHIQTHTCWRHHQLSCLALIIHHDQHESFRDSIVYQLFRNQISVFRVISSTLPWPLYPRRKIVTFPLGVFHCYCGYLNICQHQNKIFPTMQYSNMTSEILHGCVNYQFSWSVRSCTLMKGPEPISFVYNIWVVVEMMLVSVPCSASPLSTICYNSITVYLPRYTVRLVTLHHQSVSPI